MIANSRSTTEPEASGFGQTTCLEVRTYEDFERELGIRRDLADDLTERRFRTRSVPGIHDAAEVGQTLRHLVGP